MDKVSWDGIHQPRNSSVSSTLSEMLDHLKATIGPLDDRFVSKGGVETQGTCSEKCAYGRLTGLSY